ncbi:RHS repeat-associated core domain-containing protein [Catenuloplanes indicus]|uniref:RHS repeat-associated protein n=1 Tax=Catenuloplanes indicus TaxID=137267 RepID=A0AAE3W7G6_9ACTN|nr:RHS repeat-associated core domain-containing protein [Catenuloplanes indicus]MDQ0370959.1 RHS repeat-associated protein [Catenuloplanes indicus]
MAAAVLLTAGMLPVHAAPAAARPIAQPAAEPAPPSAAAPDCTGAAPDEASAMAAARACGTPIENMAARTEDRDVRALPGGGWEARLYAGPMRMRGASGSLIDIDLTMRANPDGSVAPVAHPAGLRIAGPAGSGTHELFSVAAGAGRAAVDWAGVLPAPVLDGNTATYPEVRPGVDLVVEASRTGARQYLVVKNRAAASQVSTVELPVRGDGVTVAPDGAGGLDFTDAKGTPVATSAAPEMWDSSVDPATGSARKRARIPVTHAKAGARATEVTLKPEKAFFDDPATVYPVIVDPSINPLKGGFDTYVRGDLSSDRSGENDLQVGRLTGDNAIGRAFVHWGTSALRGKQITSATVYFWNWYSTTCSAKSWEIWSTGAASTATRWGNQPAWQTREATSTATKGYTSSCDDGWTTISGTSFFQRAATANQSTAYMGIRATSETDTLAFKQFRSAQAEEAAEVPYAVVNYNSYPNALAATTLQPGDATETGTTTPQMKGVFSDADGGTGRVDFEIYDRTGATSIVSGSGATVANGAESAWTVPGGELDANTTYRWRARGHDGSLGGPWSEWRFMTTSDGSPTGDQRRFSFQDHDLADRLQLRVNVANGNLLLKNTDLKIHGTGTDLIVDRYYNSRSTATSTLGKGWVLGTGQDVKLTFSKTDHATADVTLHAPTGFTARFINSASNSWRTPSSLDAKLTRNTGTGEFRLKFDKSEGSFSFADSTGRLLRSVDKNDNTITFGYDTAGNVTTMTDTQDRVVTLAYANGRLVTVTDPSGRRTSYGYDSAQNLQTVTDAAGGITRFDYTGDRLTRITTPGGRVTDLGYEPETSRMLDFFEQANPGGTPDKARYTFTYSAGKTEVLDPNGTGTTTHTYESRDRVTKVKDALGHEQSKKYNANDNVETQTDALTNATTFGWDPNTNNLTTVGIATGAKSTLSYDDTAHPNSVTSSTDAQGNTMGYSYDSKGNKTATESAQYPGRKIDEKEYNDDGTVKWSDDAQDVRTSFTYDAKGNLTKVDNPAPLGDITVVPDGLSRMVEQTDGKGQRTRYEYDKLDRIDKVTYANNAVVDYVYDNDGNLVTLTDPSGTTWFTYDGFGRVETKTTATGGFFYEYDRNGNLTGFTDDGGRVGYTYDKANLLSSMQEPGASGPITFTYDENNRRRFMYLPTTPRVTVEMKYDKSGRQTSITSTDDSSGAKITSFTYSYAKSGADSGLRQSVTDLTGTTGYAYDKLNRLTSATGPGWTRSYGYDENFNRTSKTEDGSTTSYDYNDAQQLTSGGSTTYTHDANGNLTGSSSGWSLSYSPVGNQTTAVTAPGKAQHAPLTYGGQDQTERRRAGSVLYDTSALGVASATSTLPAGSFNTATANPDDMEPAPGTTHHYTRDNTGNLISLRAGNTRYYYLVDGLGSVSALINGNAQKVNSYTYDPYGKPLTVSQQIANPWRYAGGFHDGPTGLTKFGARYYDPGLGRFTQRDPSGKDLPYTYVGGNPANYTDPTGNGLADIIGDIGWFKDLGELGANVAKGDGNALVAQAVSMFFALATEVACNIVLGFAAPVTAGASMVIGQIGCIALSTLVGDAMGNAAEQKLG